MIATFHPANVLRAYENRVIVVADLLKAKRESLFPDIRRPERFIWLYPTIQDLHDFKARHIDGCDLLSVDLETTKNKFITCISFAPTPYLALVLPFHVTWKRGRDPETGEDINVYDDPHYWDTVEEEAEAWKWIQSVMEDPLIPKVGQNFSYDMQYLYKAAPFPIRTFNLQDDTMLMHHALHPEMKKSLDFLGSIYTDEAPWKIARPRGTRTMKREE
jgi:DNA polymerase I-like protein with 3'-5' exonuclease and polymerase domains